MSKVTIAYYAKIDTTIHIHRSNSADSPIWISAIVQCLQIFNRRIDCSLFSHIGIKLYYKLVNKVNNTYYDSGNEIENKNIYFGF